MAYQDVDVLAGIELGIAALSEQDDVWIRDPEPCMAADSNQFVAFLKPEIAAISDPDGFRRVVTEILDGFTRFGVQVGAVRLVSGGFFERTNIMAKHYGVINAISTHGASALTDGAREALHTRFAREQADGYELLGGHQLLREYREFSPFSLSVLFSNLGSIRLGPGAYVRDIQVEGRRILLLNGFHPYQLEKLTRKEAVCILFEGRTTTSWKELRQDLIGATDPASAALGSFRRTLRDRSPEFGLAEVNQNANGIHLSAGPLEGMVEVARFFGDTEDQAAAIDATCFATLLRAAGCPPEFVNHVAENPTALVEGASVSAFDLTEEMDAPDAVAALRGEF